MTLIRVEALNFVAGFVIRDGVVVKAAPILKKALLGKTADEAREIIKRKGWLAFHVPSASVPS